ncbi:uncharacterized protein LOC133728048 isoform X2 [Rosa rugosa]|uniref:uncharacterized protein LOC133728048 isoform X2 n=1 Tax=Rosa rugosa TaxID=74645 RepID=UPI002B408EC0|nr:uncharacterized protein LOC133728048 isoform X2 [Rosa rugosa]
MGRIFVLELEGRSYRCKFCKTHLALFADCVSRVSFFPCDLVRLFIVAGEKRTSSTMRPLLILDISQTLPSTMTFPIKRQAKIKQKQNGNESTVDTERLACWERRMNPKPHTIGKCLHIIFSV